MHRARVWKAPRNRRGQLLGWPWVASLHGNLTYHPTWEDAMECAYALVKLYSPGMR